MLDSMLNGLHLALGLDVLGLMVLATFIGNFFGAVPGLGPGAKRGAIRANLLDVSGNNLGKNLLSPRATVPPAAAVSTSAIAPAVTNEASRPIAWAALPLLVKASCKNCSAARR